LSCEIDQLGGIKAQIATLKAKEKKLADAVTAGLIELKLSAADGDAFRVSRSVSMRTGLNTKKVTALLDAQVEAGIMSRQKRTALNTSSEVAALRLVARKT
jgi:hypothetical protein